MGRTPKRLWQPSEYVLHLGPSTDPPSEFENRTLCEIAQTSHRRMSKVARNNAESIPLE